MKDNYANFCDYLDWRGDLTFEVSPLNPVDIALLCKVAYLNFDGLLKNTFKDGVTAKKLRGIFKKSPDFKERCNMGAVINSQIPAMFLKAATTARFKDIEFLGYQSVYEDSEDVQFAAMTFRIQKGSYLIAFRGTDDTIAGWKEDFDLCHKDVIPSQKLSLDYVHEALSSLDGDFVLAGHSKGGNLVLYAGAECRREFQPRIKAIYDYDGPGFSPEFFTSQEFLFIKDKLHIYYPEFDIVGMLFHHPDGFSIVKSTQTGILQHDMMSWKIIGTDFIYGTQFTKESRFFATALNDWVDNLTVADRRSFVNVLFDIIRSTGARCNMDIENNKLQCSAKMVSELFKLDNHTREQVWKIIAIFLKTCRDTLPMFSVFNFTGGHSKLAGREYSDSK